MTLCIGLTGGIASGKSTVASMFVQCGAALFDTDKTVHHLYHTPNVIAYFTHHYPDAVKEGAICRKTLAAMIHEQPEILQMIEAFIHPLVQQQEQRFRRQEQRFGTRMIIVDIPLLVETDAQNRFDYTVLTHAPLWLRKQRAMRRPHMNEALWQMIIGKQLPDNVKRKTLDDCIYTGLGYAESMRQVKNIYHMLLLQGQRNARNIL